MVNWAKQVGRYKVAGINFRGEIIVRVKGSNSKFFADIPISQQPSLTPNSLYQKLRAAWRESLKESARRLGLASIIGGFLSALIGLGQVNYRRAEPVQKYIADHYADKPIEISDPQSPIQALTTSGDYNFTYHSIKEHPVKVNSPTLERMNFLVDQLDKIPKANGKAVFSIAEPLKITVQEWDKLPDAINQRAEDHTANAKKPSYVTYSLLSVTVGIPLVGVAFLVTNVSSVLPIIRSRPRSTEIAALLPVIAAEAQFFRNQG